MCAQANYKSNQTHLYCYYAPGNDGDEFGGGGGGGCEGWRQ